MAKKYFVCEDLNIIKRNMKTRRRKLQETKEPEEVKQNQESDKDDNTRDCALLENVGDKRRKLEDIPIQNNAQSRAEDAVIIENKIQSLIQIEEPQSTKGEIESDVQSIQEPLPIKSVEDLENQHTILPINKGEKKYMEESLKQGIDKGNDLLTDDNNMSNNSRYICHANQDVETVTTSSSGDDPTCKFVANHSNLQMKPPTDLAGRCQNNTYMFDELDLLGKNHTEVTSISVIAEEKKMKNHSKLEDKITNISFDLTEKITDHFLQTEKIHQTNSCGIQHKANENDYIIKQQLGGNAALKSDMSCTETVSEIYMEPQENHTCSNINTENLKPFHERKKDSNKEDDLNFGPTSNDHLVECLFDQSEVSELKVKQEVNNPGMPSADIHEADIIHPDDRQSKDITDSQLCDVDWMSQFPEEISLDEPVQVGQEADQSRTAGSNCLPIEDGSAIMVGFIKELSLLNKMLLKTKREMETARRQRKTSSNI